MDNELVKDIVGRPRWWLIAVPLMIVFVVIATLLLPDDANSAVELPSARTCPSGEWSCYTADRYAAEFRDGRFANSHGVEFTPRVKRMISNAMSAKGMADRGNDDWWREPSDFRRVHRRRAMARRLSPRAAIRQRADGRHFARHRLLQWLDRDRIARRRRCVGCWESSRRLPLGPADGHVELDQGLAWRCQHPFAVCDLDPLAPFAVVAGPSPPRPGALDSRPRPRLPDRLGGRRRGDVMASEGNKNNGCAATGGAIYGLGIFGAWVYFWQAAAGFWEHAYAVFQGLFWPAYMCLRRFRRPARVRRSSSALPSGREHLGPVGDLDPARACRLARARSRAGRGAPSGRRSRRRRRARRGRRRRRLGSREVGGRRSSRRAGARPSRRRRSWCGRSGRPGRA